MGKSRRHFLGALSAGVTGALAGCGGGGTASPELTPRTGTETTPQTETASTPQTETETPEADQIVSVGDDGFQFSPSSVEIPVGSLVRWEWDGSGHNVKPDTIPDESEWTGTPGGESETFDSGHSYSYTFETAGEYEYYCDPHRGSGMTGSFTVTE